MSKCKFILLFLFLLPVLSFSQKKDLEKAIKKNQKLGNIYWADLSKAVTLEEFLIWERNNFQFKIFGYNKSTRYIFGVQKECITQVNFLPRNQDALVELSSGKLFRMQNGIETIFDSYHKENQGLIKAAINGKWGCVNALGKDIIPFNYSELHIQQNGLVKANIGSSGGYFDIYGDQITPWYDDFGNFSNGLARVKLKDKYGFIGENGKEIIPIQYESAGSFSEGLVAVRHNGKWGFINNNGQNVIPFKYDAVTNFSSGRSLVTIDGENGCINKLGNTELKIQYLELKGCSDNEIAKVLIEEGTFTGRAIYKYSFGLYDGGFMNGKRHGSGRQNFANGQWYEGEFKDDVPHGRGTERVKDKGEWLGFQLTGTWVNGYKHGKFIAHKGTWLTGSNKWEMEFDNGRLVTIDQTDSAFSDFMKAPNVASSNVYKIVRANNCRVEIEESNFFGIYTHNNEMSAKSKGALSTSSPTLFVKIFDKIGKEIDSYDNSSSVFRTDKTFGSDRVYVSSHSYPISVNISFINTKEEYVEAIVILEQPALIHIRKK